MGLRSGVSPGTRGSLSNSRAMKRVLYHHRTQGHDVEAVHILGLAGGLRELGFEVEIAGPPSLEVDQDHTLAAVPFARRRFCTCCSHYAPQRLYVLTEIGNGLHSAPRH